MKSIPKQVTLEKLVALCKRRGFVYPSAEIYGGLNGVYDFGHLGSLMKQNIRKAWLNSIAQNSDDILVFEGALLGAYDTWKASGHVDNFSDPMVDCLTCKHRYRTDDINLEKNCPHCGNKSWTSPRQFNMMFQTQLGASTDHASTAFLRPETAQSIFINFKNVHSTNRIKIPFGIAQIGKAFRNEITPKQFLFRMREFEQMELEWFCKPEEAAHYFEFWIKARLAFYEHVGIKKEKVRIRAHEKDELSHYSKGTSDVEYEFPFGWKELEGIANRGDFDLKQHSNHSGKDLSVYDEDIIEGEERIVLRLHPRIAPITAAFFPLTKKQLEPMKNIYEALKKKNYQVQFDESGSIGKRYRRQDEIGTPLCFTFDFESETDHCVTVRNRDTTKQERIAINTIETYLRTLLMN